MTLATPALNAHQATPSSTGPAGLLDVPLSVLTVPAPSANKDTASIMACVSLQIALLCPLRMQQSVRNVIRITSSPTEYA